LLSNEYGPFDRLVELGVFLLILYEVGVNVRNHRRDKKRKALLDARVAELKEFAEKGKVISQSVPTPFTTNRDFVTVDWILQVNKWNDEVLTHLAKYSHSASIFFPVISNSIKDSFRVNTPTGSTQIAPDADGPYQELIEKLGNLQRIMENPEAYF
jgi:hypothetical protein